MSTWVEVAATLERHINEVMAEAYPHDWDENYLSRQLLHRIQSCLSSRPYLRGSERVQVSMECYKLTGKLEMTFGDIGLLITVAHKGAAPITGGAYLEAKRREPRTVRFPEIKVAQARRILRRAPKAALLLYDYDYSTQFVGPLGYVPWSWKQAPLLSTTVDALPVTKVRVVPLDTALATGAKDTNLYVHGVPLSIQLVARYFCGLDLEFSSECVLSLAGWSGKFMPKRLAVIRVAEGGGETTSPEINRQTFAPED